jgi:antitoxin ParD1/3/4
MTSMNISLPEEMKAFVEEQLARGGFSTASEYIRHLIRKDQNRARIDALIIEGIESGPPIEVDEAYWEDKRRRLEERRAARAKPKEATS